MQPRCVQMPTRTSQFSWPFLVRLGSVAGAFSGRSSLRALVSDSSRNLDLGRLLDLLGRAVADEHRLAAPHHGDGLPFLDGRQVDLGRGQRLRGGVRVHLLDEWPQRQGRTDACKSLCRDHDEIAAIGLFRRVRRQVSLPLHLRVRDCCWPRCAVTVARGGGRRRSYRAAAASAKPTRQGAPASARTWRIVDDRRPAPPQDVLTRVLFALF